MMKKFVIVALTTILVTEAVKINNQIARPFTLGNHFVQEYALSNTTVEEKATLEARLATMTRVTVGNTH